MKRMILAVLACGLAFSLSACLKQTTKLVINADATGTLAMTSGYSVESLDSIAEYVESISETLGEGDIPGDPLEKLEQIEQQFSEKGVISSLKKAGVEVTSSNSTDKDGWKTVEVTGKIKDVNAWVATTTKDAAAAAAKAAEEDGGGGFSDIMNKFSGVRFYKTSQEGVGELEFIPPLDNLDLTSMGPAGGLDPDDIPEGMEEMIEAQVDAMKERFGINDLTMSMTVSLPGDVVSTKGCKKSEQKKNEVSFSFKGSTISFTGVKDFFGMKDGVSATFKIPKGCKIKFEDKKAKKVEKKEATDKAKPKKGGLGLGDKKGDK